MRLLLSSFGHLILAVVSHVATSQEDVRQPPAITEGPPDHRFFRVDELIKLPCAASGTPEPTYEWLKNGDTLNLNAYNLRREEKGDLQITGAGYKEEGYYQCVATNQYGRAVSNVIFLQRAFLAIPEVPVVNEIEVTEGQPFSIPLSKLKSVPPAQYVWAMADQTVATDDGQTNLARSKRLQWLENGDLHFAYAIREDSINNKIYKAIAFNHIVDLKASGSYTRVKVKPAPGGIRPFHPELSFNSPSEMIGLEGINNTVSLQCFFKGYPEPTVTWRGPNNNLPIGRFQMMYFNTLLKISHLRQSDSGSYTCDGSNSQGRIAHSINLTIHASPVFRSSSDQPQNVNITEGNSTTFRCNAYAVPAADVTWMMNGVPLDTRNLPSRISISPDLHSLTTISLCRDCSDRDSHSDLMVIQCNASNRHGYAFGSGYLNVLKKTTVSLARGDTHVTIENNERRSLQFQCIGMSDPSTAVRHTWYHINDDDERSLVFHSPPVVVIDNGMLTITAGENTTSEWKKLRGRYQCVASNNYSSADVITTIEVLEPKPQEDGSLPDSVSVWIWLVVAVAIFIGLMAISAVAHQVIRKRRKKGKTTLKSGQHVVLPASKDLRSGDDVLPYAITGLNVYDTIEEVAINATGQPPPLLPPMRDDFVTTTEYTGLASREQTVPPVYCSINPYENLTDENDYEEANECYQNDPLQYEENV